MKYALIVGVSEYGSDVPPLSAPPNDVNEMRKVLEDTNRCGFDRVMTLINPTAESMKKSIMELFKLARKQDLILFYFSGHGFTDEGNHLYLSCKGTSKEDFQATSVDANFLQTRSIHSFCKRQIFILDCCYSGAFKDGWTAKSSGLDIASELGAEGRVVLTSTSSVQQSFESKEHGNLGVYTKCLVEGLETGAADADEDGKIFIRELHTYAKQKVSEIKPGMTPQIIQDREGEEILISRVPFNESTDALASVILAKNADYLEEAMNKKLSRVASLVNQLREQLSLQLEIFPSQEKRKVLGLIEKLEDISKFQYTLDEIEERKALCLKASAWILLNIENIQEYLGSAFLDEYQFNVRKPVEGISSEHVRKRFCNDIEVCLKWLIQYIQTASVPKKDFPDALFYGDVERDLYSQAFKVIINDFINPEKSKLDEEEANILASYINRFLIDEKDLFKTS